MVFSRSHLSHVGCGTDIYYGGRRGGGLGGLRRTPRNHTAATQPPFGLPRHASSGSRSTEGCHPEGRVKSVQNRSPNIGREVTVDRGPTRERVRIRRNLPGNAAVVVVLTT